MGDLIYVTQPSGARFKACACIRDSWPTINKLARLKGYIRQQIDVTQGSYSTSVNASALTHAGGGVLDTMVTGAQLDALLEECGIAAYERTEADGFSPHSHVLWIGCPHLHDQAAAQVTSWRNLRNGLRSNALDRDKTRPSPIRNWEQGLAWAKAQLAQLEDDMALTDSDIAKIADRTTQEVLGRLLGRSGPTVAVALQSTFRATRDAAVDVDESLIAAQVAALILAPLTASLTAKLDGIAGVDAKVLAAEVVAELGAALQG